MSQQLTLSIRNTLKTHFEDYGMTDAVLNYIDKKSPTLVSLLNKSNVNFHVNTASTKSSQKDNLFSKNDIVIGVAGGIQRTLLLLAHEL